MEEKRYFPPARISVSTSRNKIIFQKLHFPYGFHYSKKSLNKRILFQIHRISVPISGNGEFVKEYLSTRRKNCLH